MAHFDLEDSMKILGTVTTLLALSIGPVVAADMRVKAKPIAPVPVSLWEVEIGARYWYSHGSYKYNLYSVATPGQLNSRLTYKEDGHTGEGFWRADHSSGFFFKGYAGGGVFANGKLYDEDFPPAVASYSNTLHKVTGNLGYATADVGWSFYKGPGSRLGVFAGYNYYTEKTNAYGCQQVVGNIICPVPIPDTVLGIIQDTHWHNARFGLVGEAWMGNWKLTGEAAALYTTLRATDSHVLAFPVDRPQQGTGWGVQLEALAQYYVTQNFSLGVGGRYWYMEAKGTHTFNIPPNVFIPRGEFYTERYGVFVQAAYKFGAPVVAKY
jgi:hypothetical protein